MRIIRPQAVIASIAACLLAGGALAAAQPDKRVYAAVEASRKGFLDLLGQIVDIDSGTGDVAGGTAIEALLSERLAALGAEVRHEPAEASGLPDNLIAIWHGSGKGRILIVAHFDTVFPAGTAHARPFHVDGDRAYGPGVGDEKAGLVLALCALKILRDLHFENFATITLLLDDSEERGSPGSTQLITRLARDHQVELNMEPGDPPDALTVWRKGSRNLRIEVTGRAAHAGMAPQDGRNAALELVEQLSALEGKFPHSGDGTTVNLTVLRAGERTNIIPDRAEANLNVRYRRAQDFDAVQTEVADILRTPRIADTHASAEAESGFPPLSDNAGTQHLATRAQVIYGEIGRTIALSGNGGASESALASAAGTAALDGLGLVGGDFHTDHEWVDLASLVPRLYLFTRLLMQTGASPP